MCNFTAIRSSLYFTIITLVLASCNKQFKNDDFTAHFGGQVHNPTTPYILFCKGADVLDTIPLTKDNKFFKTFDSLAPGLYTFRNDPEYQYVYFDKNDSLMVNLNAKDFDASIVFCGRGDQKNNFLMEVFLKNAADRNEIYPKFDYDAPKFTKSIDESYAALQKFYESQKSEINWSAEFDVYARAAIDFHHYSKKEMYPLAHRMRTGKEISAELPADFYAFRKEIDFNNTALTDYAPFMAYSSFMLNNIASDKTKLLQGADASLLTSIHKMKIADMLFTDEKVKNTILNNIAFTYLLEDQSPENNQQFLQTFRKLSTDNNQQNEITRMGNAISQLESGKMLPEVTLLSTDGKTISSSEIKNRKTVIFCWTSRLSSHFVAAHQKVLDLMTRHPEYQFTAVNLDANQEMWTNTLARYNFPGILQYRTANADQLKDKWALTKIHRTIILNENGTINNAFTNLFDVNFENKLSGAEASREAITSR